MFSIKAVQQITVCVYEDLLYSVQHACPELQIVVDVKKSSPVKIYVANSKHLLHFKEVFKSCQNDKENILLLLLETDHETLNSLPNVRYECTTMETLSEGLNGLLERWVCDVAKCIVETLQSFAQNDYTGM